MYKEYIYLLVHKVYLTRKPLVKCYIDSALHKPTK